MRRHRSRTGLRTCTFVPVADAGSDCANAFGSPEIDLRPIGKTDDDLFNVLLYVTKTKAAGQAVHSGML